MIYNFALNLKTKIFIIKITFLLFLDIKIFDFIQAIKQTIKMDDPN